jgi:hypothetical protein
VAYHLDSSRPMMASFLDGLGVKHEEGSSPTKSCLRRRPRRCRQRFAVFRRPTRPRTSRCTCRHSSGRTPIPGRAGRAARDQAAGASVLSLAGRGEIASACDPSTSLRVVLS